MCEDAEDNQHGGGAFAAGAETPARIMSVPSVAKFAPRNHALGSFVAVINRPRLASRSALGSANFLFPVLVTLFAKLELLGSWLEAGMQAFLLNPVAFLSLACGQSRRQCAEDNGLANNLFHLTA
jgi:hypothetical protein